MLLVAEVALLTGATQPTSAASTPKPDAATAVQQPSKADILESDIAWAAEHAEGSKAWAVTEARRTGKKVEVTDETTATTHTVANPDGTLTTELTTGPERVWRDGQWRKVDATLTTAADGGVRARSHPGGLRLAGKAGKPAASLSAASKAAPTDLVTLGDGDRSVTLQWKGGLPQPELHGTTARYQNAVPGADVIVEATRTGFEQFVEIAERPSAGGYSYTLPVRAKGLAAKANQDGSVSFTDTSTGEVRATMPAPVMWDASRDNRSGKHENRARVGMKVVNKGRGAVDLVITPDAKFLADPATQYPVTVDPSTSALGNLFDTYVQQGETVDWSGDTELDFGNPGTKNADGTYRTARSFVTWNTAPIADALVSKATLSLWNFHSGNTDCTAQPWEVWTANNATTSSRWTNQPTMGAKYATSTATRGNPACTATDGWITADVTNLAQYWAGQKWNVSGMGLRASSESDIQEWKRVNSANNTANQPKLSVTYNYRPSDGTSRQAGAPFKSYAGVWAVNTTTPILRDTFADADGDQVNGTFQVYDAATNTPITTPLGEGLLLSPYGEQGKPVSVTVPAGQLKDGRTYKFRTNAYDGTHYNLNWSPWTQFVVDTTAPSEPTDVVSSTYPEGWVGGGAGTPGTWTAGTTADSRSLQYRVDGSDADPETGAVDAGTWESVNTTTTSSGTSGTFSATPETDGNHQVEVRSVDRADNVGATTPYGFVAGGQDTNRPYKVDITMPAPDVDAPDPAYSNAPMPAFGGWNGWQSSAAGSGDEPAPQGARTLKQDNAKITVTPVKQRTKAADQELKKLAAEGGAPARSSGSALAAAGYTGPVITDYWCDATRVGLKSMFSRDEACLLYTWTVQVTDNATRPPKVYQQSYEMLWQLKLNPVGDEIKQFVQFMPLSGSSSPYLPFPAQPGAINLDITAQCPGTGCTEADGVTGFDWQDGRSPTWAGSLDGDLAQGNATLQWNGSVANASGSKDVDLSKELPLNIHAYFTTHLPGVTIPTDPHGDTPTFDVRCDKVAFTGKAPGCVFPDYVPGFALNSKKFPAAAAHAWLIQNKLAGNYGRDPLHPLMYLPKASRNSAGQTGAGWGESKNRYRICYGPNGMVYHKDTGAVPELSSKNSDKKSCDEYPFNATYQSAGMPAVEGGLNSKPVTDAGRGAECVQTYVPKLADGTWKLYDDRRYAAPTWSESCGRSSMSNNVNTQAMGRFGTVFVPEFRMLDRDPYWVRTTGLENCDASADTVKCTMTP
ncbi:DNRLRE domain-containing protein [Streptomyces pristinaespiralis]|nr:DNRLRE domain-containing protein [Streptomyces pristinaespiralis]